MFQRLTLILFTLLLFSCSEGDDTGLSNNLLPLAEGNYWIYETTQFEEDGEVVGFDSNYVKEATEIMGEPCYALGTVSGDFRGDYGNDEQITHYRTKGTRIYAFSDFITNQLGGMGGDFLPIEFEEEWLLLINENDDFWRIYDQELDGQNLFVVEINNGSIEVFGSNEGDELIEIMGKSMNAKKFKAEIEFFASATVQSFPISIDLTTDVYFYFVDGIGLVKTVAESAELELPFIGTQEIPASESVLIDYKLN